MFTEKTVEEIGAMSIVDQTAYFTAKKENDLKVRKSEIAEAIKDLADKTEIAAMKSEMETIGLALKSLQEKPSVEKTKVLKDYIMEHSEVLKSIKANKTNKGAIIDATSKINMSINKATEVASDIGGRDYLGTIEAGIEHKPVRKTVIMDLFRRKPVSTEYLHYWEEDVVTRNAKFVIACATSTHNTKKTWAKRTVELAKIRDIVDICIDMLDDYSFVEGEMRDLVNESIKLLADSELLLGSSAAATDLLSIDFISSEFNPANVLAPYSLAFIAPTIGDLTAAMKAQIYTFGQENKWEADTIIMNYNDMIKYLHEKDANNNYLFPNFVFGATDVINGMRIVTSPICVENTLYVFDSTKGAILDRKMLTVNAYYENKDNAEHELVTFVGVERLQFHVRLINRDAFMKCSDITQALIDITRP